MCENNNFFIFCEFQDWQRFRWEISKLAVLRGSEGTEVRYWDRIRIVSPGGEKREKEVNIVGERCWKTGTVTVNFENKSDYPQPPALINFIEQGIFFISKNS